MIAIEKWLQCFPGGELNTFWYSIVISTQNTFSAPKLFRIRVFMCLHFIQMDKNISYIKLLLSLVYGE